jgi:hypothetical protein
MITLLLNQPVLLQAEHFYRIMCDGRDLLVANDSFVVRMVKAETVESSDSLRTPVRDRLWFEGDHGLNTTFGVNNRCDSSSFVDCAAEPWSSMYPRCVVENPDAYQFATDVG